MKRYLLLIALVILAAATTSVWAQAKAPVAPADYEITWYTIDGGGGTLSGGVYTLDGTIGQADAGTLNGGSYTLDGGYWSGSAMMYRVYLPLVLKSS